MLCKPILAGLSACAFLAGCSGLSQTSSTSPTLPRSSAQKVGGADSLALWGPPSQGRNSQTRLINPAGGKIHALAYGGFKGTFAYAPNDAQALVTITMTNSGQNNIFNAPLPAGTSPLLYLAAQVSGNQSVTFQADALEASISSASLATGSSYTMYLYAGATQVASLPLGAASKGKTPQLKFSSPLQGVSISPGTPLVMEITAPSSPNVFVADTFNFAIKEILEPDYTTVNTLGSGFVQPYGVAVDGSGNVFVADTNNQAVKEILAPDYTTINVLGSGFKAPIKVAVDGSDNVFVTDLILGTISEILAPDYTTVNTIASGFQHPLGIAVDGSGNIFFADAGNNAVDELLAPDYTTIITIASGFSNPQSVAIDGSDDVYVADYGNNAIKEILAPDYTTINTLGTGFFGPCGVSVDASGNVYVADSGNNAVKEILAPGYTTINTLGSGFRQPEGVAVYNPTVFGNIERHDRRFGIKPKPRAAWPLSPTTRR